jgi:peptidoglycan L-alanyl-D-glutamate endopeptidase CwlK
VHPDLVRLIEVAIKDTPIDFVVTEGLRTPARQRELIKAGASQTMRSRHLTGHAVDLACLVERKVRWDWPLYEKLAKHIKDTAKAQNIPIEWGGDWTTLKDGPHYQLPWAKYK